MKDEASRWLVMIVIQKNKKSTDRKCGKLIIWEIP